MRKVSTVSHIAVGAHEESAAAAAGVENKGALPINRKYNEKIGDRTGRVELAQQNLLIVGNKMLEN